MKAERRHELKHNELADWLGERMEILKPHATGILLGVVLLVLLVLGGVLYFSGESRAAATAWSDYFGALNEEQDELMTEVLRRAVAAVQRVDYADWLEKQLGGR